MTQTPPPLITPSPAAPDRADRNTFSARATAWSDWLKNNAVSEIAAVAANVYNNAVDAFNNATSSSNWADKTDGFVSGADNSAKSWAVGGTGDGAPAGGSAKDWATKATIVDGDFSAKKYATDAGSSASAAAASAAAALTAPGTSATSTTSLTIATGVQNLTIQTGKAFSVGQSVAIAYTTMPYKRMGGVITAYDSGTGALTVNVDQIADSGTFSNWTVSLGALPAAGASLPPTIALSIL